MTTRGTPRPGRTVGVLRGLLIAGGVLIMGYAAVGVLTATRSHPVGHALFLAGVLAAHDGVFLPLVIGAGVLIGRFVPVRARPAVRVVAIVGLTLGLVGVALVACGGRP